MLPFYDLQFHISLCVYLVNFHVQPTIIYQQEYKQHIFPVLKSNETKKKLYHLEYPEYSTKNLLHKAIGVFTYNDLAPIPPKKDASKDIFIIDDDKTILVLWRSGLVNLPKVPNEAKEISAIKRANDVGSDFRKEKGKLPSIPIKVVKENSEDPKSFDANKEFKMHFSGWPAATGVLRTPLSESSSIPSLPFTPLPKLEPAALPFGVNVNTSVPLNITPLSFSGAGVRY